jgi:hypothetical protein
LLLLVHEADRFGACHVYPIGYDDSGLLNVVFDQLLGSRKIQIALAIYQIRKISGEYTVFSLIFHSGQYFPYHIPLIGSSIHLNNAIAPGMVLSEIGVAPALRESFWTESDHIIVDNDGAIPTGDLSKASECLAKGV